MPTPLLARSCSVWVAALPWQRVASQQSAYQALVSAASTVWNTALIAADSTYVAALANAAETHAGSTAQAERDFVGSVADAYETYQTQAAQALRDQQVALAGAQRDLDAGGSQSAYDAAVAAANAAHAATIKSAADQLAATMAAAEGQQQLATAQAALVRAQAVGPANVTWVTAYSAADLTHVNSRTDAYVTTATDLANGISDYATQEAASLATAISDFATLHASPWATYDSARTSALHAQVVVTAPALATRDIAMMTAQAAAEVATVEAQNDYYEAVAQADRDESIDTAQAAVDRATTSKQATNAMVTATGQAGAQQAQGDNGARWHGLMQVMAATAAPMPSPTFKSYSTGNSQSSAAPGVTSMADFTAGAGQAPRGFVRGVSEAVPEETGPTAPARYQGYWHGVGQVFLGYWDAAEATAKGVYHVGRHPLQTIAGVGKSIAHPILTYRAIRDDIVNKSGSLRGQGALVGDVLIGVATGGAMKAVSKTAVVARIVGKIKATRVGQAAAHLSDATIGRTSNAIARTKVGQAALVAKSRIDNVAARADAVVGRISGRIKRGTARDGASVFEEFGVTPGKNLNLDVASAANNRSYITYAFKDAQGNVVYVGRGSGPGTPRQVMAGRLRKGHDHFHEGLAEDIVDVQKTLMGSQGAEEVFKVGFQEQGAKLTNVIEALSYDRASRIQRSLAKIEAYLEELAERGLR